MPALAPTLLLPPLATLAYYAPHMSKYLSIRRLRRRLTQSRSLVLTYDDGPGPHLTPALLDLLAEYNAKATFFVLGRQALLHPQLLDRILAEGHRLASHGFDHLNAWKSTPQAVTADIAAGYRATHRWLPPTAPFRPPCGKLSLATCLELRRHHSPLAWWTIDSGDTFDTLPSPSLAADTLARQGGGIVLLHDFDRGLVRTRFVLQATRLVLNIAQKEGLQLQPLEKFL